MILSGAAPPSLGNRVAVVTGSNKGIGFHIALQLATSGLFRNVILGCRDANRGQTAVQQITDRLQSSQSAVSSISFLPLEVGDPNSHASFHRAVQETYGRLDVLVNNAGFAFKGADPTPFARQTKPTLDINFRGTVDLTEELLPLIRQGDDPRIVHVASGSGRLRQLQTQSLRDKFTSETLSMAELRSLVDNFESDVQNGVHRSKGWSNSNYGMSKLALIASTRVMAREEAKLPSKVKINSCCPGYCATDMSSHKGPRPASEGAKTAVLLAIMENCPTGEFFQDMARSEW